MPRRYAYDISGSAQLNANQAAFFRADRFLYRASVMMRGDAAAFNGGTIDILIALEKGEDLTALLYVPFQTGINTERVIEIPVCFAVQAKGTGLDAAAGPVVVVAGPTFSPWIDITTAA